MDSIKAFIAKHRWIYAKTMPYAPHEYVCKKYLPASEHRAFEEFVIHIREHGVPAYYGRRLTIYWLHEGHYYWTMGSPVEKTIIINRADANGCQIKDGKMVIL